MSSPLEKGNALENAVKAIEQAILQSSPGIEKDTFLIESKKIVIIDGVRHEIDVWVEIDHGKGYKSIFIFECKNWENSVGKNEIIIFSEKIDSVQAQKGFFVAKSFTKYSDAQAKKDKRITLLNATKYSVENIPIPFDFHIIAREKDHGNFVIIERNKNNKRKNKKSKIDIENATCLLNGEPINLEKYLQDWVKNCADQRTNIFPSGTKAEGNYELEASDKRMFNEGELLIDNKDIEKMELTASFTIRVARPGIVSHYEVETRGRILTLAPVRFKDGGHIQVGFVGDSC